MNPDDANRRMKDNISRLQSGHAKRFGLSESMPNRMAYQAESYDAHTWFHGGYPGLGMGSSVLPAASIGYRGMQDMLIDLGLNGAGFQEFIDPRYDPSSVYLTRNRGMARDHAAAWSAWNYITTGKWEPGKLYKCDPVGLITPVIYPMLCCCLLHGPETFCTVRCASAFVYSAEVEVTSVLQGRYAPLYEYMRTTIYPRWVKNWRED